MPWGAVKYLYDTKAFGQILELFLSFRSFLIVDDGLE